MIKLAEVFVPYRSNCFVVYDDSLELKEEDKDKGLWYIHKDLLFYTNKFPTDMPPKQNMFGSDFSKLKIITHSTFKIDDTVELLDEAQVVAALGRFNLPSTISFLRQVYAIQESVDYAKGYTNGYEAGYEERRTQTYGKKYSIEQMREVVEFCKSGGTIEGYIKSIQPKEVWNIKLDKEAPNGIIILD